MCYTELMATPKGYTTRQDIENYLLITVDPSFYTQVNSWIALVETFIEGVTGRVFIADSTASERVYDGDGSRILLIDDAVQITKLEIDDIEQIAGSDKDYLAYPANSTPKRKLVMLSGSFTRGNQNITVTAKWGYSTAVPEDLKFAATVMVAGIINFSNAKGKGPVTSITIGRFSVSYDTEQQKADILHAREIVEGYKRFEF